MQIIFFNVKSACTNIDLSSIIRYLNNNRCTSFRCSQKRLNNIRRFSFIVIIAVSSTKAAIVFLEMVVTSEVYIKNK